jgi:hypothetical protein
VRESAEVTEVLLWEHGHAYQPRRVLDGVLGTNRSVPGNVRLVVRGKEFEGANWFNLMLQPGSVYTVLVEAMKGRSLDIEPLTLHYLKQAPTLYNALRGQVRDGRTHIVAATYAHPILPLLAAESLLDARVNVAWGLHSLGQELLTPQGKVFIWLSECAYSNEAAQIVTNTVRAVFGDEVQTVFLLDERQATRPARSLGRTGVGALVVLRSTWLSDAYAFSPEYDWIPAKLRDDILARGLRMIGTMIDAETYGGAYDAQKPRFFATLHDRLSQGFQENGSTVRINLVTVDHVFDDGDARELIDLVDYTSWSDYRADQLFTAQNRVVEGIIAERAGGLCRWTGRVRRLDGYLTKKTYFIVYEWVHPVTKQRYLRVVNTLWKVAFTAVRAEGAETVRKLVTTLLNRVVGAARTEALLVAYWRVVFGGISEHDFAANRLIDASPSERRAVMLLLRAYRLANQDSQMSDPTFWQNFDTEVTWTALASTASGLIHTAQACCELNEPSLVRRIARVYQALFLDFPEHFRALIDEYDLSVELFYQRLTDAACQRGYPLHDRLNGTDDQDARLETIAEEMYEAAFGGLGLPLYKPDVNVSLLRHAILLRQGRVSEADRMARHAKMYEWSKSIGSTVSELPIPMRVGFLHAKHFPDADKHFNLPTTDVVTRTEIIIGEAHAYMPRRGLK